MYNYNLDYRVTYIIDNGFAARIMHTTMYNVHYKLNYYFDNFVQENATLPLIS